MTRERAAGVALVLGVTGRAGSAVARAAADHLGLDVLGVHRGNHAGVAQALEADLGRIGRSIAFTIADASTEETARETARVLGARGSAVQVFVHALAGASVGSLAGDPPSASGGRCGGDPPPPPDDEGLTPRQIERTFAVMAHSFVYWVRALRRAGALAPSARLIGLTNPMTDSVVRGTPVIAASKAALEQYVRHLAAELGPEGHRVNLIKYGGMPSAAVERTFSQDAFARATQLTERHAPNRRMCTPEEVAELVCLLASPAGGWFNGANIDFTGGEFQGLYEALIRTPVGGT